MNYVEAMAFLDSTKKYGSIPGLDSIRNLMNELGNVQDQLNIIHIAGTNGKGSVGAILSTVYTLGGWKTGRFCTPDVFSYEEEFTINDAPISRERLAEVFEKVKEACERLIGRGLPHPTRFEVETAAAFLWMWEEQTDIVILETGMGGSLDATNLIRRPLVSVFTSVGMDHEAYLGDTLEKIAETKAGIIKEGCPGVSAWQDPRVQNVLERSAKEKGSEIIFAEKEMAKDVRQEPDGICFSYGQYKNIKLALNGRFQVQNGACALEVIRCLEPAFPVSEETIRKSFSWVCLPGRLEKIAGNPEVYIDGAHNPDAARKLRETLDADFTNRQIIYIMGVLKDKDYEEIADIMLGEDDFVITVTPDNPRALDGLTLMDTLREKGYHAVNGACLKDALELAFHLCTEQDMILAFGSLSYLKEFKTACMHYLARWSREWEGNDDDQINEYDEDDEYDEYDEYDEELWNM